MTKITGSYELEAAREIVWPRIYDPVSLMELIPGCQRLEKIGVDEYSGQIQIGVAGVIAVKFRLVWLVLVVCTICPSGLSIKLHRHTADSREK